MMIDRSPTNEEIAADVQRQMLSLKDASREQVLELYRQSSTLNAYLRRMVCEEVNLLRPILHVPRPADSAKTPDA
jgi:hypothetical protein